MENNNYSDYFTVDGTVTHCLNDTACPSISICYKFDPKSSIGVCGCNYEYGQSGDQCNEKNATGIYRMVVLSLLIAIGMLLLLFNCRELLVMGLQGLLKKFDAKVTTLIATLLTILLGLVRDISGIIVVAFPNKYIVLTSSSKYRPLIATRVFCASMIFITGVFAIMNIGIVWLNVAIASNKFVMIRNPQISKRFAASVVILAILLLVISFIVYRIDTTLVIAVNLPYFVIVSLM